MLRRLTVIILQCVQILNHYVVCLGLIKLCVSYTLGEKKEGKKHTEKKKKKRKRLEALTHTYTHTSFSAAEQRYNSVKVSFPRVCGPHWVARLAASSVPARGQKGGGM